MNYQMRLTDLMLAVESDTHSTKIITGMSLDSRKLSSGELFISLATNPTTRALHIKQAIGANIAALCFAANLPLESGLIKQLMAANIEMIAVDNLKDKVAHLAAIFYQHPSVAMTIIAVTGTNGKTSVTQYIAQVLENAGQPCGVIGTLGCGRLTDLEHSGMTTPDPVALQAVLAEMRDAEIQYVALEASSHALQQNRLNCVEIDYAVLTNLSRDHLDYHQTMVDYATAKQRLFSFASLQGVVVNADDGLGQTLLSLLNSNHLTTVTYSCKDSQANLSAADIDSVPNGLHFTLQIQQQAFSIQSQLLGRFNIENILATAAIFSLLGWSAVDIAQGVSQLVSVNGRMQRLASNLPPAVVIDFAHTPGALTKALQGIRQHMDTASQLWCVFGCGGERDTGKRPLMGQIASELADKVVLTDDNPRGESSAMIIEQTLAGCPADTDIHIEADRKRAIELAVFEAALDDMVLIAGKGHEHYQEISGVKVPFNDYEIAMQVLQKRHSATRVIV